VPRGFLSRQRLLKRCRFAGAGLFATAQGVHVDGQHLDGGFIQTLAKGRHHTHLRVGDLRDDFFALAAIKPNGIG
jgi:hypothetical protein